MLYDSSDLRRAERAMPEAEARRLLATAEHGVLCLGDTGGGGYGVPLNYAWDEAGCIYMHCANEGHKLNCIRQNPHASLVIMGQSCILPPQFSTAYESVMVQGIIEIVEDEAEKRRGLELLIRKLTPQEAERGMQYIDRAVAATTVLRLRIHKFCGKMHRPHTGSPA